jgi:hypothetical protein
VPTISNSSIYIELEVMSQNSPKTKALKGH